MGEARIEKELPRWVSHKTVWGDQIDAILPSTMAGAVSDDVYSGDIWLLKCGVGIKVTRSLIARGEPKPGDYYVRYADGYESWSPAKAFEDGYRRQ